VLPYVLRNKPDLDNSSLLGCHTVIKKKLYLSMTLKANSVRTGTAALALA
jgi:hypothetical protein